MGATLRRCYVELRYFANSVRIEPSNKVGAVHSGERVEDVAFILIVVPKEEFALCEFLLFAFGS